MVSSVDTLCFKGANPSTTDGSDSCHYICWAFISPDQQDNMLFGVKIRGFRLTLCLSHFHLYYLSLIIVCKIQKKLI